MAKEEERKEQELEGGGGDKKSKGALVKWVVIGAVVALLVGGGAAGFLYFKKASGKKEAASKEQVTTAIWTMEPFIVNLIDNNGERYLKISIELEVSDKNIIPEMNKLKPKLRDNVLDLLTAKSYKDLVDMVGKQRLRDEIMMRLNSFLVGGKIVKVYFTEFVIQ
ncbi:MAG: flagellar basal body-associated FliL family protein [Syntrophales bacterium]